jgi:hypothetical protein
MHAADCYQTIFHFSSVTNEQNLCMLKFLSLLSKLLCPGVAALKQSKEKLKEKKVVPSCPW